ncbi:fimbrial protein [Pseudomonas aeruginosa]|nr:type 1 fimbrial protein [Pseudomonas aeruginosa]HDZ3441784.1 type 1 fimbrial protein [Pseudomonas aeruginosa]
MRALLSAWVLAALWGSAWAVDENIIFSGVLFDEPCVLAVEDSTLVVDFKGVVNKDLYLNGRTRSSSFEMHLNGCDREVEKRTVSIKFVGRESDEVPGFLALDGAGAHGLLVGLEEKEGKHLPLNKSILLEKLAGGDNVVSFNAYLRGTPEALSSHSLGLGAFEGTITFTFMYE